MKTQNTIHKNPNRAQRLKQTRPFVLWEVYESLFGFLCSLCFVFFKTCLSLKPTTSPRPTAMKTAWKLKLSAASRLPYRKENLWRLWGGAGPANQPCSISWVFLTESQGENTGSPAINSQISPMKNLPRSATERLALCSSRSISCPTHRYSKTLRSRFNILMRRNMSGATKVKER